MLPDPSWLFTHPVTIRHFHAGPWGELATPVPATTATTGHFQEDRRIVRDSSGQEVVSAGVVYLPGSVTVGAQDMIDVQGGSYRVVFVASPRDELATPVYHSVRVI